MEKSPRASLVPGPKLPLVQWARAPSFPGCFQDGCSSTSCPQPSTLALVSLSGLLSQHPSVSCSYSSTPSPCRMVSSLPESVAGAGRAPSPGTSPKLPACWQQARQLAPEGPFSSQGLSSQSPDAFILGALPGKVLCQGYLQATAPPPPHTHPPHCHPACSSIH